MQLDGAMLFVKDLDFVSISNPEAAGVDHRRVTLSRIT